MMHVLPCDRVREDLTAYHDGLSHRDPAEQHHGLRLVIAAADHPGAIEKRHAVIRQFFTKYGSRRRKGAGTG